MSDFDYEAEARKALVAKFPVAYGPWLCEWAPVLAAYARAAAASELEAMAKMFNVVPDVDSGTDTGRIWRSATMTTVARRLRARAAELRQHAGEDGQE